MFEIIVRTGYIIFSILLLSIYHDQHLRLQQQVCNNHSQEIRLTRGISVCECE